MNLDGVVNDNDVTILNNYFEQTIENNPGIKIADVNEDGVINTSDEEVIRQQIKTYQTCDLNLDGKVDAKDLEIMNKYFGKKVSDTPEAEIADLNKDGMVNARNMGILRQQFGN